MLLPALLALLIALVSGKALKWTSNPYLIPPVSPSAPTQYLVFHGPLSLNHTLSRTRCEALGGDLADVDSDEAFRFLHARLHTPAFIGSFLGKTYGGDGSGLALYPGGAVAIPEGGGAARFPSICEVPVMGTYTIDLTRYALPAESAAKVGDYSGEISKLDDRAIDDLQRLMSAGFVMSGRRDPRFAGLSQQDEPVNARSGPERYAMGAGKGQQQIPTSTATVTTVTIYGSIVTDPALPCCRCCA